MVKNNDLSENRVFLGSSAKNHKNKEHHEHLEYSILRKIWEYLEYEPTWKDLWYYVQLKISTIFFTESFQDQGKFQNCDLNNLGHILRVKASLSQHVCEVCGQTIPSVKDIPGPSSRSQKLERHFKLTYKLLNSRTYPFKYPMYHVIIHLHLGYAVDAYPLSTHM